MEYKTIVSDIDGTIVPVKMDAVPSQRVVEAIRKATQKGVIFCLATGRPFSLVEYLVDYLELKSPIIVDNGAAIYSCETKQPMYEALLEVDEANKIIAIIHRYKKQFHVSTRYENLDTVEAVPTEMRVRKIVIHGLTPTEADNLINEVEAVFKNVSLSKASAHEGVDFFDVYIANANANKQVAVLELAKMLEIDTKEIIAMGDHYNDFPLFMASGFRVAMGNAVEDLKAIADYIAPSLEDDGAAHAIEKFVL